MPLLISWYSGICRYFSKAASQCGLGQGRNGAKQRLPFGDRQAAVGQARGAAHDHHAEDQEGSEIEPEPDRGERCALTGVEEMHGRGQ